MEGQNGNGRKDDVWAGLRDLAQRRVGQTTKDFAVPGYDRRLWATFRALTEYADVRRPVVEHQGIPDDAEREVLMAVDTLLAATVGAYALMPDGEKVDLGVPLGLGLAGHLGFSGLENDRQAVLAIFKTGTADLMEFFGDVTRFFDEAKHGGEAALVGESEAAG